jgi:hypothetical protein
VATVNLLEAEGHYSPDRVERISAELTLPAMASLSAADLLGR